MTSSSTPRSSQGLLRIDAESPDRGTIKQAVEALSGGGVIALPTDTVYGLAADIACPEALEALYEIKARPKEKALILFVEGLAQAREWVQVDARLERLAEAFWPGPLTLVLPGSSRVPGLVRADDGSVALRIPDHAVPRQLGAALGRPLVTTSANRSGTPSLTDAGAVHRTLGDELAMVLDSGPAPGGQASTVASLLGKDVSVLRAGPITEAELLAELV